MQAEIKQIDFDFPFRGINESSGIDSQPDGTSPLAFNVRGYDQIAKRDRGAQRIGMIKIPTSDGGEMVDRLVAAYLGLQTQTGINLLITAANLTAAGGGDYTRGDNDAASAAISITVNSIARFQRLACPHTSYRYSVDGSGGAHLVNKFTGYSRFNAAPRETSGSNVTFKSTLRFASGTAALEWIASVCFSDTTVPDQLGALKPHYVIVAMTRTAAVLFIGNTTSAVQYSHSYTISGGVVEDGNNHDFVMTITSGGFSITRDAVSLISHSFDATELTKLGAWTTQVYAGMSISGADPVSPANLYDDLQFLAVGPDNVHTIGEQVCIAQGGQVSTGTVDGGFTLCDASGLARGDGKAYTVGNPLSIVAAGGYFWLVDGDTALRRIDPVNLIVEEPTPTTTAPIPEGATLLALFRDRLWHGGFAVDPFNFIASRSGDYLDYDEGSDDPDGAFAGNSAIQAGLVSDAITAFVPFGDVSMVIGMASSTAIVRGDPKAGGSIDYLSREVGIAVANAYARTPNGALFLLARDGLYILPPGGASVKEFSRGRMDTTLGSIDFTTLSVVMSWDPLELGLKIILVPADAEQGNTIVFWEQRKDALWVDTTSAPIRITAATPLRGSGGPGGNLLLGCQDGYIRVMDPAALDDDGYPIVSRLRFTPKQLLGMFVDAKIVQTRFYWGDAGGEGNFNVKYSFFMGNDALDASNNTAADYTNTVTISGYQAVDRTRIRGACAVLEIGNDVQGKTWQVEKITSFFAASGRIRT